MQELPFRLKRGRLACSNARFYVYFDTIEDARSHDKVVDFLVIESQTENVRRETGVNVLPIRAEKAGLLRVYRHPVGEFVWEAAKGFIDLGETAPQAACRELLEETGCRCTQDSLHDLGTVMPVPGVIASKVRLFAVHDWVDDRSGREGEFGHEGLRWFSLSEIRDMVDKGEILDSLTLIALYRAMKWP